MARAAEAGAVRLPRTFPVLRVALAAAGVAVVLALAWWGYRSPDLFMELVRLPFCS
jgi:hypothetical protein